MISTVIITLFAFVAGLAVARKNQSNTEYTQFADAVIDIVEVPIRWAKKQLPERKEKQTKPEAIEECPEECLERR